MNTRNRNIRFTLRSLLLFIVCCGLFVGAGNRLWRFYGPGGSLAVVASAPTAPPDEAGIARLAANVKSPSIQTRLDTAIALRRVELDPSLALSMLEGLLQDEAAEVRCEAIQSIAKYGVKASDQVSKLITALDDPETPVRQAAADALGQIGAPAQAAVPALIDLLADDGLRASAVRALRHMGSSAAPAAAALNQTLERTDAVVRHEAIITLMNLGPAAEPAIEGLVKLLKCEDKLTRQRAAMALGRIGPPAVSAVPDLLYAAQHDPHIRDVAVQATEGIDRAEPEMLPVLREALEYDDKSVRVAGARLMRRIGPAAQSAIGDLVELLRSEPTDEEVKAVALTLRAMGPASIPELCRAIHDNDPNRRRAACCVVSVFGADARQAIPALIEATQDDSPRVRAAAVMALGKIGPAAGDSLPTLVALCDDVDPVVRQLAAAALAGIGTEDDEAISKLLSLTRDPIVEVRFIAVLSLAEIRQQATLVVPVLIELLDTPEAQDSILGTGVMSALGRFGPDAVAAVPRLIQLLSNHHQKRDAARALGEIGPAAVDAVPMLIDSLWNGNETAGRALSRVDPDAGREVVGKFVAALNSGGIRNERFPLVQLLGRIGPLAAEAVPSLALLLPEDEDGTIAVALGEIGPDAVNAVPAMIDAFQSGKVRADFRWQYIVAFGKIGPKAAEAVPLLIQTIQDFDPGFRLRDGSGYPRDSEWTRRWESNAKRCCLSLGQIGPAARAAAPKLLELSQYTRDETFQVPVPESYIRQRTYRFALPRFDELEKSVSEMAREALERIQFDPSQPRTDD